MMKNNVINTTSHSEGLIFGRQGFILNPSNTRLLSGTYSNVYVIVTERLQAKTGIRSCWIVLTTPSVTLMKRRPVATPWLQLFISVLFTFSAHFW